MMIPTPKRYLVSRLTPKMEAEINFLLHEGRISNQGHLFSWLADSLIESGGQEFAHTFIPDVIRYIVVAVHPPNKVLGSPAIQRYSMIQWLLKQSRLLESVSCAKLALFFDWFMFDPKADSIMNVEPGVLLIFKSLGQNQVAAASLLEFLKFSRDNWSLDLCGEIQASFLRVLSHSIELGVVSKPDGFLASPTMDDDIKEMLQSVFSLDTLKATEESSSQSQLLGAGFSSIAAPIVETVAVNEDLEFNKRLERLKLEVSSDWIHVQKRKDLSDAESLALKFLIGTAAHFVDMNSPKIDDISVHDAVAPSDAEMGKAVVEQVLMQADELRNGPHKNATEATPSISEKLNEASTSSIYDNFGKLVVDSPAMFSANHDIFAMNAAEVL